MYTAGQNTKAQFPRKTWRPDMASSSHFNTVIYISQFICAKNCGIVMYDLSVTSCMNKT